MASYTPNYNLKKPLASEFYNIADFNDNVDKIDTAIKNASNSAGASLTALETAVDNHISDKDNPHEVTTGQIGAIPKVENPTEGNLVTLNADGTISDAGMTLDDIVSLFVLEITFEDSLVGTQYTVTGGDFTYSGVVDSSLKKTLKVPYANTTYTVSYLTYSVSVDVTSSFGIFYINASTGIPLNIIFREAIASGEAFTITGGEYSHTGTVPGSLKETVSVPYQNTTYTVTCLGVSKTVVVSNVETSITINLISSPLSSNSWAVISKVATTGSAVNYWAVGDTKDITLTTGEVLTLQIYGFNHDYLADGSGKAGITFGLQNLMAATRQMNTTATNVGSFAGSALKTWLNGTLYSYLPSDLRSQIKSVNKITTAGNKSTSTRTDAMNIFAFSYSELASALQNEGTIYSIFSNGASLIKKLANGSGAANFWWTRSPDVAPVGNGSSTIFLTVDSFVGGFTATIAANDTSGVCFGFCI